MIYVVRRGFTLLELLVTIGIIGVLASIVIVAIDPTGAFTGARNSERKVNLQAYDKAINQYVISEWELPSSSIPSDGVNALPICRVGITDVTCVNLDNLVPDYMATLPVDPAETNTNYTGYSVYKDNSERVKILSIYDDQLPGTDSASDYVAYWRFDENSGSTATDSSSNNHDGTINGATAGTETPATITFQNERSLDLDGDTDYVSVPAAASLRPASAISICSWVYMRSWHTGEDQDIIVRSGQLNGSANYAFEFNNDPSSDRRDLTFRSAGSTVLTYSAGSSVIDLNEWNHLCVTYDNITARIYANGTLVATSSGDGTDLSTTSQTIYLGGRDGSSGDSTDGYLDDLRIYARELTAAEVTSLANGN